MNYAQIDETGLCVGVSQLSRAVTNHNLIPIETPDAAYMGMYYQNGLWIEAPIADVDTNSVFNPLVN